MLRGKGGSEPPGAGLGAGGGWGVLEGKGMCVIVTPWLPFPSQTHLFDGKGNSPPSPTHLACLYPSRHLNLCFHMERGFFFFVSFRWEEDMGIKKKKGCTAKIVIFFIFFIFLWF